MTDEASAARRWRGVTREARRLAAAGDGTQLDMCTGAIRHTLGLTGPPVDNDITEAVHRTVTRGFTGEALAAAYLAAYRNSGGSIVPYQRTEVQPLNPARLADLTGRLAGATHNLNSARDNLGTTVSGATPETVRAALVELHHISGATRTILARLRDELSAGVGHADQWITTPPADPVTQWRLALRSLHQANSQLHDIDALLSAAVDALTKLHTPAPPLP